MKQEPTFLVCGEALVDVFAPDPLVPGSAETARPGGSPFNVAAGLVKMAQSVAFLGGISRDTAGVALARFLAGLGVDMSLVASTDAPTTQSLVGTDAAGHPTYEFRGEGAADRQLTLAHLDGVPEVRAMHVGSYTMLVEPIASTLRTLIERRRDRTFIAWDPNVRPPVVSDGAPWRGLYDWMAPRVHLLKLSVEDLAFLAPGATAEDFAKHALAQGVALVVVTRGADGASGWTRHARADVPAAKIDVVDTVGAGDTVQAALLTWLAERDLLEATRITGLEEAALREMLAFAARAAGVTCSRRGADTPYRSELS